MNENIIQLYDNDTKLYPISHKNGVYNSDGMNAVEQVEKKITQNINDLNNEINEKYDNELNKVKNDAYNETNITNINKNKINAMEKVGEGITHEFITNNTKGWVNDIPQNAKLASIKKIGGRSLVWNQLISVDNLEKWANTYEVKDGFITSTTTRESYQMGFSFILNQKNIGGHKYFYKFNNSMNRNYTGSGSYSKYLVFLYNKWETQEYKQNSNYSILTCKSNDDSEYSRFFIRFDFSENTNIGDSVSIPDDIILVDLTKMYGIGKEPTADEFNDVLNNVYNYSEPQLIHNKITSIKKVGHNLLNLNNGWRKLGNMVYDELPIEDISNKKYNLIFDKNNMNNVNAKDLDFAMTLTKSGIDIQIELNNINKLVLGSSHYNPELMKSSYNFTKTQNNLSIYTYFRASLNYNKNATDKEKNDFLYKWFGNMLLEKNPGTGVYTPYTETVYEIPEAIRNLDGYGWGVSDEIYNYIDLETKTFHKRVGCVDLGTLNWNYNNYVTDNKPNYVAIDHRSNINNFKPGGTILCKDYVQSTNINFNNMEIRVENNVLYVGNESFTDKSNGKKALSGVILYYELKNEEIIDISDYLPDNFLESLEVEGNGSFIFKFDNDLIHPYISNEIEYLCDLTDE